MAKKFKITIPDDVYEELDRTRKQYGGMSFPEFFQKMVIRGLVFTNIKSSKDAKLFLHNADGTMIELEDPVRTGPKLTLVK